MSDIKLTSAEEEELTGGVDAGWLEEQRECEVSGDGDK